MNNLKDSQTYKNIKAAFAGESMARNRYTFYEEQARKEGKEKIADMYARMSKNEMMHAKLWFKLMDAMGDSAANLEESAKGENMEWTDMYPQFAQKAKEEGFDDIARLFEQVAGIEQDHEKTFLRAYVDLKQEETGKGTDGAAKTQGKVKEKASDSALQPQVKIVQRCMFCGAIFENHPDVCSVCGAIGSFETAEAIM